MRSARRFPTTIVALAAMGCRGPAEADLGAVAVAEVATAADFPGAAAVLAGFDPLEPGAPWRGGDEVLFGLRLRRGHTARHWLLHLRLTEPIAIARAGDDAGRPGTHLPPLEWTIRINGEPQVFSSARCRTLATVLDAQGNVLGRSEPELPRDFLATGFGEACELVARGAQHRPRGDRGVAFYRGLDVRPFSEATVTAVALLQVVQDDHVLSPLLWEVIERPSLWSVVTNLGARVILRPRFHAAVEVPSAVPAVAHTVWQVPMGLLVNDETALAIDLFVTPAAPPVSLCGGVLGATARHPHDPDLEFAVLLLAARRGRPSN